MSSCTHLNVRCLNQFELICKYLCEECGAVMMCACDENFGRKFLPHQLDRATELETQKRIPVSAGFQPGVCCECRGLPPIANPVAEIYGRTSKIRRYYWRELAFMEMERFAAWAETQDASLRAPAEEKAVKKRIETEVLQELKHLHATSPKYTFVEESQAEVIERFQVEVVTLRGIYGVNPKQKGVTILDDVGPCDVEEFASRYFRSLGFETLFWKACRSMSCSERSCGWSYRTLQTAKLELFHSGTAAHSTVTQRAS